MLYSDLAKKFAIICLIALTSFAVGAQDARPVQVLVGFTAGGTSDLVARLLSEHMKDELQRPILVVNKPGAGGRLAAQLLKYADADGTTLLVTPVAVPVVAPLMYANLPYDPVRDFAPVAQIAKFEFILSVRQDHPANTVSEFIDWVKANPAHANYGSPAPGSLPHFFGLTIARAAGVDFTHVPYSGGAPLRQALLAGEVSAAVDTVDNQLALHKAGKVRILATSGAERNAQLPDTPTFLEAGLEGVEGDSWFAMYAPANTPAKIVDRINRAVNKALQSADLKARFTEIGLQPTGGTPEDLGVIMARDTKRWRSVVDASGYKAE